MQAEIAIFMKLFNSLYVTHVTTVLSDVIIIILYVIYGWKLSFNDVVLAMGSNCCLSMFDIVLVMYVRKLILRMLYVVNFAK